MFMQTKILTAVIVILAGLAAGCQGRATQPAVSIPPPTTPSPIPSPAPTATSRPKNLIERADLRTKKGPVYSQDWSADGRWLVTADTDQIRVWDTAAYQTSAVLEGHTDFVWGLAWSPASDILASASQDGSVRLWDAATFTQIAILETGWAYCVDWSPDGKLLAIGTSAGDVQVWDAAAQQLLHTWKSETRTSIISIAWSPDGKTIASGEWGGEIYLWDVETGQVRQTIADYTKVRCDVNGLAWSPDGSTLASAHQDGNVRLWNASGQLMRTLDAHAGWARGLAWSPDGVWLLRPARINASACGMWKRGRSMPNSITTPFPYGAFPGRRMERRLPRGQARINSRMSARQSCGWCHKLNGHPNPRCSC